MTQYLIYDPLRYEGVADDYASRVEKATEVYIKCKEAVKFLTNNQLLEDYSDLLQGDDWDGEFTLGGSKEMQALDEELRERLTSIGFLTNDTP